MGFNNLRHNRIDVQASQIGWLKANRNPKIKWVPNEGALVGGQLSYKPMFGNPSLGRDDVPNCEKSC